MGLTGSSGFTVGELIRLFCSDLASQISRRMHFYKSAPMIREGMIIVHTSGLAGDPALAKVRSILIVVKDKIKNSSFRLK